MCLSGATSSWSFYVMYLTILALHAQSKVCLFDWLIYLFIGVLICWLIDWVISWLIYWFIDLLVYWFVDLLIFLLIFNWFFIDWLIYLLIKHFIIVRLCSERQELLKVCAEWSIYRSLLQWWNGKRREIDWRIAPSLTVCRQRSSPPANSAVWTPHR